MLEDFTLVKIIEVFFDFVEDKDFEIEFSSGIYI